MRGVFFCRSMADEVGSKQLEFVCFYFAFANILNVLYLTHDPIFFTVCSHSVCGGVTTGQSQALPD